MSVAIINYGMGNVASVKKAIDFLGYNSIITNDKAEIEKAKYIVLPGVGAFSQGMKNLKKMGLIDLLNAEVINKKKPFLGICLGMQMLASKSFEIERTKGLDWIKGEVIKIQIPGFKVPHLGWNELSVKEDSIFKDFHGKDYYFIHSYHFKVDDDSHVIATVNYGDNFVAALQKDNIYATQFHPEKSQTNGLNFIKSFFEGYA